MTHRESPENLPGVPPKKASRTAHQSAWGQGRLRPQVDGTAGLPSAPEMACAPRGLRLGPRTNIPRVPGRRHVEARVSAPSADAAGSNAFPGRGLSTFSRVDAFFGFLVIRPFALDPLARRNVYTLILRYRIPWARSR